MTVPETLEKAVQWLQQGWATQAYAKDSKGVAVDPCDTNAVAWCANGAIIKATNSIPEQREAARELKKFFPEKKRLSQFNDEQESVEGVVKLFEETIQRLKENKS